MSFVDKASRVVGWAILFLTIVVLVRPGGLAFAEYQKWRLDASRRQIVEGQWLEFAEGAEALGDRSTLAENRIVEFVDYTCYYCRQVKDTISKFLRIRDDQAVVIRHLPNPVDKISRSAALASVCAAEMGQFRAMHEYLLTYTDWMDSSDWTEVTDGTGISDIDAFRDCLESSRAAARLAADSSLAARLSLTATPAFVTRHQGVHTGVIDIETMSALASEK